MRGFLGLYAQHTLRHNTCGPLGDMQMPPASRIPCGCTLKDYGILEGNPSKAKTTLVFVHGLSIYKMIFK